MNINDINQGSAKKTSSETTKCTSLAGTVEAVLPVVAETGNWVVHISYNSTLYCHFKLIITYSSTSFLVRICSLSYGSIDWGSPFVKIHAHHTSPPVSGFSFSEVQQELKDTSDAHQAQNPPRILLSLFMAVSSYFVYT